jgi:hypothetical protein
MSSVTAVARATFILVVAGYCGNSSANAQSQIAEERRPLLARDVCLAMATQFATGDTITFENGHFRAVKGAQSVTVYGDATPIAKIPGFSYPEYNHCLDIVISSFEGAHPATDAKNFLESFMAGYELADIQNIGVCIQPAAMGGFYLGDRAQGNVPSQKDNVP